VVYGGADLREGIEEVIRHTVYGFSADETARTEIHRLRMRMENEIARESDGAYNIKTGRGGMVDVEFIVQYLLLKYGHVCADIRNTCTLTALKCIRACNLLAEEDGVVLQDGYKFLRRLETRLRIVHDCSMNDLGGSQEYLDKLARRLGYEPRLRHPGDALLHEYEFITTSVRAVYDRILGDQHE
jgi:glutamate-ammonia-ligase adenylyltransferase